MQTWRLSRELAGKIHQREKEKARTAAWGTLKKGRKSSVGGIGGKGERDRLLSLRSMPESTPGALCFRAEWQDNKWKRLSAGEYGANTSLILQFSNILQYSRYCDSMLYNVLWCTDSHSSDCCKYPRGEHVKSSYTFECKETWITRYGTLLFHIWSALYAAFHVRHFITPLSIGLAPVKKAQIQQTVDELFFCQVPLIYI